jgi:hypothetical protein
MIERSAKYDISNPNQDPSVFFIFGRILLYKLRDIEH